MGCTRRVGMLLAICVIEGVLAAATPPLAHASNFAPAGVLVLDDFHDVGPWHAEATDDVKVALHPATGTVGKALCMDFDFGKVSGAAIVHRALALNLSENFELGFNVRGDAPINSLQLKFLDASGDNVWWVNRPKFIFPHVWRPLYFKKRDVEFAWGPTADHSLKQIAAIEFVVAAGKGGKGTVCFDQLVLRALPAADAAAATVDAGHSSAPRPAPVVTTTSRLAQWQPTFALDGSFTTAWRSDPAAGPDQLLTLDFGERREFGGLILHWLYGLHATRYSIDLSDDAAHWQEVRRVSAGNGGTDPIRLAESAARYLRVHMQGGPASAYALAKIEVMDPAFGATPNAFLQSLAKNARRGDYPRGFSGEQAYWTVVGIDGGSVQALISEDGAIEFSPGTAGIEPMLLTDQGLLTWADVSISQSLRDGYLPMPKVTWHTPELQLQISAFAMGEPRQAQLVTHYTVENHAAQARSVTLVLAVRPFQVNPPTQLLNISGGFAPVHALAWDGRVLSINGEPCAFPLQSPTQVVMGPFDAGNLPELLAAASFAPAREIEDSTGMASGALLYRLKIPAHGARSIDLVAPLTGVERLPGSGARTRLSVSARARERANRMADAWVRKQERATAAYWRTTLNQVQLRLPPSGRTVTDTLRSALAHILIERDGPALRPGTRSYPRTWIRDATMMSEALLRLGREGTVREFADWFAPYQFSNGKIPCCVDQRGSDPVPENDSEGEFLYLVGELNRYGGDVVWLREMWPRVSRAAAYMETLRQQERGTRNTTESRRAYFGLMPPSISHEGYSDKPAYSYWDDFWALTGYRSATQIATALGYPNEARALAGERDEFRADLLASIDTTGAQHQIEFIPGSADRGDFDATSTTIALAPGGVQADLPQERLRATFERSWRQIAARRDGRNDWDLYTPYEMRLIGSFVRLGQRDRAVQSLNFYLDGRRPLGWNQWGEVVRREPRKAGFIGDLPHGWVESDYIRSVLDMFAYEREIDHALVLAAAVPNSWMSGQGVDLRNLRTPYGRLSYTLRRIGQHIELNVPATLSMPPGGLVLRLPMGARGRAARVNGKAARFHNDELRIMRLPARVVVNSRE